LNLEKLRSKKEGLEARLKTTTSPQDIATIEQNLKMINDQIRSEEGSKNSDYEKHDPLTEQTLKPVNKVRSKLDKELQEWEVESTKDGQDSQGNG
jgi:hypothetical protein